jgi:hypothetical protein
MKTGLIVQGGLAAFLLLVGLLCVASSQRFYPATLPFLAAAAACVLLAVRGVRVPDKATPMFWPHPLHGLLFFPFRFAIRGGWSDDDPMIWLTKSGWICIAGVLGLAFVIIGGQQ